MVRGQTLKRTTTKIHNKNGQDYEEITEKKLLELEVYEQMFFHFLSILALLPQKRDRLLQILDTYK